MRTGNSCSGIYYTHRSLRSVHSSVFFLFTLQMESFLFTYLQVHEPLFCWLQPAGKTIQGNFYFRCCTFQFSELCCFIYSLANWIKPSYCCNKNLNTLLITWLVGMKSRRKEWNWSDTPHLPLNNKKEEGKMEINVKTVLCCWFMGLFHSAEQPIWYGRLAETIMKSS